MIYDGGWLLSQNFPLLELSYLALALRRPDSRRFLQIPVMELILMEQDRPGDSFGNCARGAPSPELARPSGYGLNRLRRRRTPVFPPALRIRCRGGRRKRLPIQSNFASG